MLSSGDPGEPMAVNTVGDWTPNTEAL
jgi:hypothetical protein